jgi:hypothetical protein
MSARISSASTRDRFQLIFGYGVILFVLWMPEFPQRVLSPGALLVPLGIVLLRAPSLEDLGMSRRGLAPTFWILPAALLLSIVSLLVAKKIGTLHPLYKGDFKHITGYIL